MAIVKHIKSRNANYSAAINYLLFEHDEKTGKKIVDESGRNILRKEFYMDRQMKVAGYVFPRSSMAAKGLVCELPPIDSGYRGEIHAIISNVSTSSQTIHKNTRVGQLVITPVVIADFVLDLDEERGTGAFGSTGE